MAVALVCKVTREIDIIETAVNKLQMKLAPNHLNIRFSCNLKYHTIQYQNIHNSSV